MIGINQINEYDSELDTVIDSLISYLSDDERLGQDIKSFYSEWPEANRGESINALACHTVNVGHEYTMMNQISHQDVTDQENTVAVLYRVGKYDIDIQVDIWLPYKAQRNKIYKKFYEIINEEMLMRDGRTSGLSLTLTNYFDTIARYDIVGYNFPDDERSSQEDEWRVKIDMKVHFDKMLQRKMSKITDTILVTSDADTGEENISQNIIIE